MAEQLTLEQLEEQVTQLPPQEQLTLVAYISERLSQQFSLITMPTGEDDHALGPLAPEDDELLAEIEAIAASCNGEFDSVAEIRQMRQERDEQIGGCIRC